MKRRSTSATAEAEKHGLKPTAFVGDMCDFTLKQPSMRRSTPSTAFADLGSEEQALAHFDAWLSRCGRRASTPAGITPTKGEPLETESWAARRGHLRSSRLWVIERNRRRRQERVGVSSTSTPRRGNSASTTSRASGLHGGPDGPAPAGGGRRVRTARNGPISATRLTSRSKLTVLPRMSFNTLRRR